MLKAMYVYLFSKFLYMNTSSNLTQLAIKYAIILTIARIAIDFSLKSFNLSAEIFFGSYFFSFAVEAIIIGIAIRTYKHNLNNGYLNFTDGLKIGMIIMLIMSIIYFLFANNYMTDYPNEKLIEFTEKYNPNELDAIEEQIEKGKTDSKLHIAFIMWVIYYIFIGFVISVILSAIFQKKQEA